MTTKKLYRLLSSCDLEPAVNLQQTDTSCDHIPAKLDTLEKKHVYIYKDAKIGKQRVQILEKEEVKQNVDGSGRVMVKMQFADNFQVKNVDLKELEGSLFICPVSLKKIGPASIRLSAATFREQFKLISQLFHQSYGNNKRLSIKECKIDIKVAENKNIKSPSINGNFPVIIFNIAKLSVLHNLSAQQLCGLRNNIVDHCLYDNKLELNQLHEDTNAIQESLEGIHDKKNETKNGITNLKTFQPIVDNEAMTVNIHQSLPSIYIKEQFNFKIIDSKYTGQTDQKIVSIVNENDDKNVEDVLKSLAATNSLDAFDNNCKDSSKSLAVYCEEDGTGSVVQLYRCLVLSTTNSTARIYLIDSAKTRFVQF